MKISSYSWLLIACCFCSVVSCLEDDQNESPIEMRSSQRSLQNEPSSASSEEEEDIECSKKCSNLSQPSKRSANPEDSPLFSHESHIGVGMKTKINQKKFKGFRQKNVKRRRKFKSNRKSAAKPPVIPSLFTADLKLSMKANNPLSTAPSSVTSSMLALPERVGGFINLTDPTREQFRVEEKKNFASFLSNGLNSMEESLSDNFGIQVPTKLFVKNKEVGLIESIAKKESDEKGAKKSKSGAKVSTEPTKAERLSRKTEKENIQLTMQIVDLLTDINVNSKDPENLNKCLKEIKSNLTSLMSKKQNK